MTDVSGALRDASGASTSGTDGGARGFYVAHMTLADLLDEGFLATHVKADGALLHALSADGLIDRDDVAAVTPNGQMHLSLTPRAYRRLGVSGLKSDDGTLKRRCVVNLAKKTFAPGGAFRDRLVETARGLRATDCALAAKRPYLVRRSHGTSHDGASDATRRFSLLSSFANGPSARRSPWRADHARSAQSTGYNSLLPERPIQRLAGVVAHEGSPSTAPHATRSALSPLRESPQPAPRPRGAPRRARGSSRARHARGRRRRTPWDDT